MTKYFDKPIPRSSREIFLLDDKYYFYDEECFGRKINWFIDFWKLEDQIGIRLFGVYINVMVKAK